MPHPDYCACKIRQSHIHMQHVIKLCQVDCHMPQLHIGEFSREGSSFKARGIRTVIHPRYDKILQDNDIAVVLLDRPSTQIPIRLPLGATARFDTTLLCRCHLCLAA